MGKLGGAFIGASLLVVVSCSLTTSLNGFTGGPSTDDVPETGTADVVGAEVEPGPADGSADSFLQDVTTTVVDGCSLAGCFAMPFGFSLVAFGATAKGAACPTGFTLPADTVEGPTVGSNACTCRCTVKTNPSCATGTLVGHYDGAGSGLCDSVGGDLANNGCGTDGFLGPFSAGNEHRFTPPAATGGTCQASPTEDATKLTYAAQGRVCQAATLPECEGKVCPPSSAAPYDVCIAAVGDVPCPAGFADKHLLGTSASFTCGSGCTCAVTATCKGKLNYYALPNCAGTVGLTTPVDDACHATNAMGASFMSHAYVADPPANVACSKGGTSAPAAPALAQPTTVCCN